MKRLIFDTNVYVAYLRSGDLAQVLETTTSRGTVHLSIVVAEELLVGAPSTRAVRFLQRLIDRFDSVGRLEVPVRSDWLRAGEAIRQVAQRQGYELVKRSRLTNDALVAATASRLGAILVTRDAEDFMQLQDYLPATVMVV